MNNRVYSISLLVVLLSVTQADGMAGLRATRLGAIFTRFSTTSIATTSEKSAVEKALEIVTTTNKTQEKLIKTLRRKKMFNNMRWGLLTAGLAGYIADDKCNKGEISTLIVKQTQETAADIYLRAITEWEKFNTPAKIPTIEPKAENSASALTLPSILDVAPAAQPANPLSETLPAPAANPLATEEPKPATPDAHTIETKDSSEKKSA